MSCLTFFLLCSIVRDNPVDELGDNFIPPTITFDTTSSITSEETINFDTGTVIIRGNHSKCRFMYMQADSEWSDLTTEDIEYYHFDNLAEGDHIIVFAVQYEGGTYVTTDTITFSVVTEGFKPVFSHGTDTTITAEKGAALSLCGSINSGKSPFTFSWFKDDLQIDTVSDSLLTIDSVTTSSEGIYYCRVKNEYGEAISGAFNVEVQAPSKYSVTYAANTADSGSVPVDETRYSPQDTFTILANTGNLFKEKYQFAGWSTSPHTDNIPYTPDSKLTMDSGNVTLYAYWTKDKLYTVTYNANDARSGNIPEDDRNYLKGSAVKVLQNYSTLQKGDSLFAGWKLQPGGDGKLYHPGDTLHMGEENITLYAFWDGTPMYSVTYLANGANNGEPPETELYPERTVIVIPNKGTLTYTGYTFTGWCPESTCDIGKYTIDDTLIISNSHIELYACWSKQPTYTVTYDANGAEEGSIPEDLNRYLSKDSATVRGNAGNLIKDGFSFIGWSTNENDTFAYHQDDFITIGTDNVVLFAVWSSNPTFNITYKGNGNTSGEAPADFNNYEEGKEVDVRGSGTLVKTGYNFTGWNSDSGINGTHYIPDSSFRMPAHNITLYAEWLIKTYRIAFISKGNLYASQTPDSGSLLAEPSVPSRTGFSFTGWSADTNSADLWIFEHDVASGNDSLFARWTPNTYHITLDMRETDGDTTVSVNYGDTVSTQSINPELAGHTFDGWYTDSLFTSAWNIGEDVVISDDTLYAKWTPVTFTVLFDAQNGSTVDTHYIDYGIPASPPEAPEKTKHTFIGWYTDSISGHLWQFSDAAISGDTTLYAHWEEVHTKATLLIGTLGNGSISYQSTPVSTDSIQVPDDSSFTLSATAADNYHFGYWKSVSGTVDWEGDSLQQQTSLSMTIRSEIAAVFFRDSATLTLEIEGSGALEYHGTELPSMTMRLPTNLQDTIICIPAENWVVTEWKTLQGAPNVVKNDSTIYIFSVTDSTHVQVVLAQLLNLTVSSSNDGHTSPSGTIIVRDNEEIPIVAHAYQYREFVNWHIVSGEPIIADSSSAATTVTLQGQNAEVEAVFDIGILPDTLWVPVTYYDFHSDGSNPEFECPQFDAELKGGMVSDHLDSEGKPVPGDTPYLNNYIKYWYRSWSDSALGDLTAPVYTCTSSCGTSNMSANAAIRYDGPASVDHDTSFTNIVIKDSLAFTHIGGLDHYPMGTYSYENNAFFPLDGRGFGNEGLEHNFSFSMTLHFRFRKTENLLFDFVGDDDTWMFIDSTLAIDVGGIHPAEAGTVYLEEPFAHHTGLTEGEIYSLHLFYNERHTPGSHCNIRTNIFTSPAPPETDE